MNDYITGMQAPLAQRETEQPVRQPRSDGLGIASLVLGVVGFLPIPGLPASILAVILGFLADKDSHTPGGRSRAANAGIVLGCVSIGIAAVISIVYFGILGYPPPQIHRYHPHG
jgi:hypothetical protein